MTRCSARKLMCIPVRAAQYSMHCTRSLDARTALWMSRWHQNASLAIILNLLDLDPPSPKRNDNASVFAISNTSLADWNGRCLCSTEFSDWVWRSVAKFTGKKCKITWLQAQTYFPHAIAEVYLIFLHFLKVNSTQLSNSCFSLSDFLRRKQGVYVLCTDKNRVGER